MDSIGCGLLAILLADDIKFRILWPTLGLVAVFLVGAVVFSLLDRWRKRNRIEGMSAGDQLTHFRELRDKGTITQEEYERIRSQLAGDLRKELNVPVPAPTKPPTQDVMTVRETPPPESPASPQ